jgi:hypothetical protein
MVGAIADGLAFGKIAMKTNLRNLLAVTGIAKRWSFLKVGFENY